MPQHCSLFGMKDQHGRDIRQEAKPQGARHTCHWAKVMTMLLMMLMMPIIIMMMTMMLMLMLMMVLKIDILLDYVHLATLTNLL